MPAFGVPVGPAVVAECPSGGIGSVAGPVIVTVTVELPLEAVGAFADEIVAKLTERAAASMSAPSATPYMTIAEAADYLRCSRQRIDDLLSSRRLARVKEGRRTLVRRAEIDAYLRTIR